MASQKTPPFRLRFAWEKRLAEMAGLSLNARIDECLSRVRDWHHSMGSVGSDYPLVPIDGASEVELQSLESRLGIRLPHEYREFLIRCRYLDICEWAKIWGINQQSRPGEEPHLVQMWDAIDNWAGQYLFIGSYQKFSDGDSIALKIDHPDCPLVAVSQDFGEYLAPSFSFGLWRLVTEVIEPNR